MTNRDVEYFTSARENAKKLWDSYNALLTAQNQWNALDYGSTLADGTGVNDGVTRAQLGAVIFDTANAIKTVMNAGNATNVTTVL